MWPVIIALVLVIAFAVVFLLEFLNVSEADTRLASGAAQTLTPETYTEEVAALLVNATAANGPDLITKHGCAACHVGAATVNNLAPAFEGVAIRAETRRPPLTAAAYLYESIMYPAAYEAGDYSAQMPLTYAEIPEQELGDIIAYLLTLEAQ